jgi:hypothetical protein
MSVPDGIVAAMTPWRHYAVYTEVAQVTGDEVFRASRPFPVDIVPARLIAKLRAG